MKTFAVLAVATLTLSLASAAEKKSWMTERIERATPDMPQLVFLYALNSCALCPTYDKQVLRHPDFLRFLVRHRAGMFTVVFDQAPYLDPKARLPTDLRAKLDLAHQFGLDVSKKGTTNPDDFPSLFAVTGPGKATRLKINVEKLNGEVDQLVEQLTAVLVPISEAPLTAQPAPGMIVAYAPNLGYAWDRVNTTPPQIYANPNPAAKPEDPGIVALALGHKGQQYFAMTNQRRGPTKLSRSDRNGVQVLFTPASPGTDVDPVVRDIRVDDADNVYFSQTRKGMGKIFKLVNRGSDNEWSPEIMYAVRTSDVPKWSGRFAFGRTETGATDLNLLCLVTEDRFVYRIGRKNGSWLSPQRLAFPTPLPVDGIVVTGPAEAFVASGQQIMQMQAWSSWRPVLTLPVALRNLTLAH